MSYANLSIADLQLLLMEETMKLTKAIRNRYPEDERDAMRIRIQEIQRLLEEKNNKSDE